MSRISVFASAVVCASVLCGTAPPARAGVYKLIYSFPGFPDGQVPAAGLVDLGGTFYGTTTNGGEAGAGNVYALNPTTGNVTVLCSFQGGTDGANPHGSLSIYGGVLYGTTLAGGTENLGTVFSVNPATGAEAVVHAFGRNEGENPVSSLLQFQGRLYGTTSWGPRRGDGTLFEFNPSTGATHILHYFTGADGADIVSGLVSFRGKLYGTAFDGGGGSADGTVYAMEMRPRSETTISSFGNGTSGIFPAAGLINVGGMLYGTTSGGGAVGYGTVFSIDPATGAETVVHSFSGKKDGANPEAALLIFDGKLYGTTAAGGGAGCDKKGCGTVFVIDPATGSETVLHAFHGGSDGESPTTELIEVGGTLYGTTSYGGAVSSGTVFSYKP